MRALSWLDKTEKGDPRQIYRKYRDRGVLDERQVLESAGKSDSDGRRFVTALLFSQTEVFAEPVPIERARELCADLRGDGYFVTTRQIDEDFVRAIYEEGIKRDG